MIPSLLVPMALFGLVSVPALLGIYLFRNRFQPQVVSSLMLWVDPRESQEGGRQLRRLTTPLLFFLELLALLFLVFAASNPHIPLATSSRPLVVVLDDSYSMLAGSDPSTTPRAKAQKALAGELSRQLPLVTRLLLASDRSRLLGPPLKAANEILDQLDGWKCASGFANLDEAVMMAGQLGGPDCQVLVLTDRPPAQPVPDQGRLQWWAFGEARSNAAFVGASRSEKEGKDRLLLEIANLSKEKANRKVEIIAKEKGDSLLAKSLSMEPGEVSRIVVTLPTGTGIIQAKVDDAELPVDSLVNLVPSPEKPVETYNRLAPGPLRDQLAKAIEATRLTRTSSTRPRLIFTDKEIETPPEGAWVVQWIADKEAVPFAGPYVLDRAHPLTAGISLAGVVWGAGKTIPLEGSPVLMAGEVPLIGDREFSNDPPYHSIRIHFRPDLSTLFESPDWPILIWNLVSWRSSQLPGLARPNLRLGTEALLRLDQGNQPIKVKNPQGDLKEFTTRGRQFGIPTEMTGIHEILVGQETWPYAVNTLNRDESDLSGAETGKWGAWALDDSTRMDTFPLDWILLLLALSAVTLHLVVMAINQTQSSRKDPETTLAGKGLVP